MNISFSVVTGALYLVQVIIYPTRKKTKLKGVLNMIHLAYVFKDSCDYIAFYLSQGFG